MFYWMLASLFALYLASLSAILCISQTLQAFEPTVIPLAIRSPYYNSWVSRPASDNWPTFWNSQVSRMHTRNLISLRERADPWLDRVR